jgi:hypothetical protein
MAAYQENARPSRTPLNRSAVLPPPPMGGPPAYTHRNSATAVEGPALSRPPLPDRSEEFSQNHYSGRGQSMPVSHTHGLGVYPMYPMAGYPVPTYTGGSMFLPHGHQQPPTMQNRYGYDEGSAIGRQNTRGEFHTVNHDRQNEMRSHRPARENDNERRDERDRVHARNRRNSWLPGGQ